MKDKIKIGIIICDRYRMCAGGKCLRALCNREGTFSIYKGEEADLVGFVSCGGCPGGNVESAIKEMNKNGAQVIHLATGLLVGYPPCPYITYFSNFIRKGYGIEVVTGTHPIPQEYYKTHMKLRTWSSLEWRDIIQTTVTDEKTRISYD